MISNRHVRWDWDKLIDYSEAKSVTTLCGSKSTNKYVGIPGITIQPNFIFSRSGNTVNEARPGWCIRCMKELATKRLPTEEFLKHATQEIEKIHNCIRYRLYFFALEWDEAMHEEKDKIQFDA